MSDKKLASEVESMDPGALSRVNDFVDDDLLSCFMWAAGENAVAQPGWESPSQKPLKGIPLPPAMPPLPEAGGGAGEGLSKSTRGAAAAAKMELEEEAALDSIEDLGDDDIADISKFHSGPMTKEQKLTQRMQRKAESARIARLRKKEYVGGLEEQVSKLQAEVARLREMQRAAPAAPAASLVGASPSKQEGQKQLSEMDALLKRPALDNLVPEVNASVEKYVAPQFCAPPAQLPRNSLTPAQFLRNSCAPLRKSLRRHPSPPQVRRAQARARGDDRRQPRRDRGHPLPGLPMQLAFQPQSLGADAPRETPAARRDRCRRAPAARSSTAAAAPRRRR